MGLCRLFQFGHPWLDRPYRLIDTLRGRLPNRPEWRAMSPRVNPSNGNLVLQLGPPAGGAADPRVVLTYNSWSPGNSDHRLRLEQLAGGPIAGDAVTAGDGAVYRYSDKDGSGQFLPPAGASTPWSSTATAATPRPSRMASRCNTTPAAA